MYTTTVKYSNQAKDLLCLLNLDNVRESEWSEAWSKHNRQTEAEVLTTHAVPPTTSEVRVQIGFVIDSHLHMCCVSCISVSE